MFFLMTSDARSLSTGSHGWQTRRATLRTDAGAGYGRGEGGRGSSGERARGTSGASEGGRFAGSAPAASRSRALVPGGGEGRGWARAEKWRVARHRGDEPSDSRLATIRTARTRRACARWVRCSAVAGKIAKKSKKICPTPLPAGSHPSSTARFRGKRKADGRFIARAVTDWAPRTRNRWVAQRFAACRAALGPRNAVLGRFHRAWRHFSTRIPPRAPTRCPPSPSPPPPPAPSARRVCAARRAPPSAAPPPRPRASRPRPRPSSASRLSVRHPIAIARRRAFSPATLRARDADAAPDPSLSAPSPPRPRSPIRSPPHAQRRDGEDRLQPHEEGHHLGRPRGGLWVSPSPGPRPRSSGSTR